MKKNKTQSIGNPLPLRIIRRLYPTLEQILPSVAHWLAFNLFFFPIKYKAPNRELPILQKAKRQTGKIDGKRTQFYSWGDERNPIVILVHGWMGRAGQFYKLVDSLVKNNYHVVSFDGPAHGASAGRQTNINDFHEAINYISNNYGPIKCAIGHSFGGITILYAIDQGSLIDNVVLISTPSIASNIIEQFEEKIRASTSTGDNFRKRIFRKYGISFDSISASEIIKRISVENLLLVHDEEDSDVPIAHSKLMHELHPPALNIYTKGLGHTRILRNDGVINKIIQNIQNCLDSGSNPPTY